MLFLSVFSPFWIAYSALLKIALMQDRYEPNQVRGKSFCRKFLLLSFLTFFGTILLVISKLITAIGETVALLAMLTFQTKWYSAVTDFFDGISSFILIDID